jgi:hypothetical protein
MSKLLPILKPASDYKGNDPLYFTEKLFNSNLSPIIAYGIDRGTTIIYEKAENTEELEKKFPKIKEEALMNLKEVEAEIEIIETQGSKVAYVNGIEYGCEKILDKEFLKILSSKIGSNSIMVGIPYKGNLMAIDSNSELRLKLPFIVQDYFNNPKQDPISDKVFLIRNEEIVAIGGEVLGNAEMNSYSIKEDEVTNNFTVEILCDSIEEIVNCVNHSYQSILVMVSETKKFGGNIDYLIEENEQLEFIYEQLIAKTISIAHQIGSNKILQALSYDLAHVDLTVAFYYKNILISNPNNEEIVYDNSKKRKWWRIWN